MSNVSPILSAVERSTARKKPLPTFRPGDTIRVQALISEGNKERIQVFEGVCIHRKSGGRRRSFTVRKVSHGVGVERVFMVDSPRVVGVELVARGDVRRAKLYYLRDLRGNAARIRRKIGDYSEVLATATDQSPIEEPELAADTAAEPEEGAAPSAEPAAES